MSRFDPLAVTEAEVARTNRLDRPYEVLSRPYLGRLIDSPQALLDFQAAVMQGQQKPAPYDEAAAAVVYVNWGRILTDCFCGDAPVVDPDWQLACCLGCGRIYRTFVIPSDFADIETALMARPDAPTRNWQPSETLQQVLDENAAHGVAVGVSQ